MNRELIYVAGPYSTDNQFIQREWLRELRNTVAHLLSNDLLCYSPILQCHELACVHGLPKDEKFWQRHNEAILNRCDKMFVVTSSGWSDSRDVRREIHYAREHNICVHFISPKDFKLRRTILRPLPECAEYQQTDQVLE